MHWEGKNAKNKQVIKGSWRTGGNGRGNVGGNCLNNTSGGNNQPKKSALLPIPRQVILNKLSIDRPPATYSSSRNEINIRNKASSSICKKLDDRVVNIEAPKSSIDKKLSSYMNGIIEENQPGRVKVVDDLINKVL